MKTASSGFFSALLEHLSAQQWDISQWSFIQIRVITRIAESIKTVNNAYKMQNKDR